MKEKLQLLLKDIPVIDVSEFKIIESDRLYVHRSLKRSADKKEKVLINRYFFKRLKTEYTVSVQAHSSRLTNRGFVVKGLLLAKGFNTFKSYGTHADSFSYQILSNEVALELACEAVWQETRRSVVSYTDSQRNEGVSYFASSNDGALYEGREFLKIYYKDRLLGVHPFRFGPGYSLLDAFRNRTVVLDKLTDDINVILKKDANAWSALFLVLFVLSQYHYYGDGVGSNG